MLGAIREGHRRAVVTVQRVAGHTTGTAVTRALAEGAVELQRVVVVGADSGHHSLGDPAVLAELAGYRILLSIRRHLALNPVLQRGFVVTRPCATSTLADLVNTKGSRCLVFDLVDRVVRQVRAVDLETLCGNVAAIKGVHQVPGERALGVVLLPERLALHLTALARRLRRVLHRLVHLVHDLVLRLLTVEETHVVHTVRSDEPLRSSALRVIRIRLRT